MHVELYAHYCELLKKKDGKRNKVLSIVVDGRGIIYKDLLYKRWSKLRRRKTIWKSKII